ncbi:uncharacterized protein BN735_00643 [Mycoplasma sp. CAG:611]|nr:uncharacterized protein BN735_00643 [Mycoplasma sp. CAG:611]
MEKLKYLLKVIKKMNFKQMMEKINEVHKKSKKPRLFIFIDMIVCGFKYQAGYMDYWLFEMYNLNRKERKTILTRGMNNYLIKKYNDPNYIHIFENKDEFLIRFKKYIKRDFLILDGKNKTDFIEFSKKHNSFMAKPRNGSCGKGIKIIKDVKDYDKVYNDLYENNLIVLEELIKQNEVLNKLNSSCINTIRIVTINDHDDVSVVASYLRIGNNNFVDNFNSGGMVVPIEIENGEIIYPALDKSNNLYEIHPVSKTKIKGFEIPDWNEILELSKKLAKEIKEVGIIGWDIALTTKGIDIVEGNSYPGHDIYQLPPHRTNNIGVLPRFEKYLK